MDFRIAVPSALSEAFKISLYRFIGERAVDDIDAFVMHWAEPRGAEVMQYVHFDSEAAAIAFQRSWAVEANADTY